MSQARELCCKMGLKLAEFYSVAEMQEAGAIVDGTNLHQFFRNKNPQLGNVIFKFANS